jgi:hypothetical protein
MMKMAGLGSESDEEGVEVAMRWMSVSAAMVLATT